MPKLAVLANATLILGPVFIASLIYSFRAVLKPNVTISGVGLVLMLIGWLLLIRVKWPQLRAGDWATLGVEDAILPAYRQAYMTLIFGLLIACISNLI